MKRHVLQLHQGMSVEARRGWNGIDFVVYGHGASVLRRCPKEVRKFLKLSVGTPSRAAFDAWLAELDAATAKPQQEEAAEAPQNSALDASDPNHQTKTVI